jgi:hypothetical protein
MNQFEGQQTSVKFEIMNSVFIPSPGTHYRRGDKEAGEMNSQFTFPPLRYHH